MPQGAAGSGPGAAGAAWRGESVRSRRTFWALIGRAARGRSELPVPGGCALGVPGMGHVVLASHLSEPGVGRTRRRRPWPHCAGGQPAARPRRLPRPRRAPPRPPRPQLRRTAPGSSPRPHLGRSWRPAGPAARPLRDEHGRLPGRPARRVSARPGWPGGAGRAGPGRWGGAEPASPRPAARTAASSPACAPRPHPPSACAAAAGSGEGAAGARGGEQARAPGVVTPSGSQLSPEPAVRPAASRAALLPRGAYTCAGLVATSLQRRN